MRMKKIAPLLLISLLLIPLSSCDATSGSRIEVTSKETPLQKLNLGPKVSILLTELNRLRSDRGLSQLGENVQLSRAAELHAQEQAARNQLDHASLNGDKVGIRVTKAGFTWGFVAENLAAGRDTAAETLNDWVNSPGHNKNMFCKKATHFGAAYIYKPGTPPEDFQHFWVLVLARPLK
jgi:uncharacterized protein YkwD